MIVEDRYGVRVTVSDQHDLSVHEELVEGYLTFQPDLVTSMHKVVEMGDEAPPLARITHAQLMAMSHTAEGVGFARQVAQQLADDDLTVSEQHHLAALVAVGNGDVDGSTAAWRDAVTEHPTDLAALRFRHFALFNRGQIDEMVRSVLDARSVWDLTGDVPHRSLLDGMACFALEEAGRYEEAEPLGRAAVAADAHDIWGVHAVSHVLEMQGRAEEGREWVTASGEVLHQHGSFAGHVWWHLALYLLETGQHADALTLFDDEVFAPGAVEGLTLTNAIALLARIEWAGGDVGDRWALLVDGASMRIGHHSHPFNDCHYTYALARAGRDDLAERLLSSMHDWARSHTDTAAQIIGDAGLATARGMAELARGRHSEAADQLGSSAGERWRIGGSHAQRDVFAQAHLAALIGAGHMEAAADLATARVAAKPESPRNQLWLAAATTGSRSQDAKQKAGHLGWA